MAKGCVSYALEIDENREGKWTTLKRFRETPEKARGLFDVWSNQVSGKSTRLVEVRVLEQTDAVTLR